jgi:hypothetical protein
MVRIYCATRLEAQTLCDKIHAQMIANVPSYAKSVADGQTVRWAVPRRDVDANDVEIGDYFVTIKDRVEPVLSPIEKGRIVRNAEIAKVVK